MRSPGRSSRSTLSSAASPDAKARPWVGLLQRGQALLERGSGRVARARVLVALVLADRPLGEGGRQRDRGDDRAGRRRRPAGRRGWPGSRSPSPSPCSWSATSEVRPAGRGGGQEAEDVGAGQHGERDDRRPARAAPAPDPASRPPATAVARLPTVGSFGPITFSTGISRTDGSRKAASMSASSSTAPDTSAAANGGSFLHTGSCDTPVAAHQARRPPARSAPG